MGAVPVICSWKEGDAVTDTDETTECTSTEVLVLLTEMEQNPLAFSVSNRKTNYLLIFTALTLPLIKIVAPLHPKMLTDWLISVSSTVMVSFS